MANIPFAQCGNNRYCLHPAGPSVKSASWLFKKVLHCTVTCGYCSGRSVFEMTGNDLEFLTSLPYEKDMSPGKVVPNATRMVEEALPCLYWTSYRGTVAFCRSTVEEALDVKEVPGSNLDEKIGKCRNRPSAA